MGRSIVLSQARTGIGWPSLLAGGAIVGQVVFTLGWVIGGNLQGPPYHSYRNAISDVGALTAHHPWVLLGAQGLAGALTIAFALLALRPALAVAGLSTPIGAWLVAGSLQGLDNLSDAFFRLDCRAGEAGCTTVAATASWHGEIHAIAATVSFALTVAAPFLLALRMRRVAGWRDWARPSVWFGLALATSLGVYLALSGSQGMGYAQRAFALLGSAGVVALALHVRRLSSAT